MVNENPAPTPPLRHLGQPRTGWLLLLGLPLLLWVLLHPRGVAVEVEAKTWRREVDIERRVQEMHSEACAQMPAGAQLLERRETAQGEHCRFLAPAWRRGRQAVAEGAAPDAPYWPELALKAPGTPEGERAGARRATQELRLRDEDGRTWSCRLPLADWQAWPLGASLRLDVHRFSGVADCASLPAAPR